MTFARQQANALLDLLRRERDALADFLVALSEFDRARRWEELGHNSLFAFLVKDLGLSSGAAAYRRAAVDLVRRFPQVVEPIRDGRLCITTVFELSKVITDENAAEVLPRFFGTSKRDAKNVVAELAPEPAPTRTVVTAGAATTLPLTTPATPTGRLADLVRANSAPPTQEGRDSQWIALAPAPTVVEPKTAELSRVHITVPRRLLEKLAAARDALSHSHPGASDAEVLEVGLDLVIERHRKRRGICCTPRVRGASSTSTTMSTSTCLVENAVPETPSADPAPPPKRSRHVPADVWRAVWERDGGRCAWPLEGGGVCGSTHTLELDHVKGFALGAGTTPDECRILCRPHQLVSARRLYGDDLMDRYVGPKGGGCSEPVASYRPAGVDVPRVVTSHDPAVPGRRPARPRHRIVAERGSMGADGVRPLRRVAAHASFAGSPRSACAGASTARSTRPLGDPMFGPNPRSAKRSSDGSRDADADVTWS